MRSARGGQDPAGSTTSASSPGSSDLTARARIRDAAAYRLAMEGFGVSARIIASDPGVSAGLAMHHFGSKAKPRDACDENMLAAFRRLKRENVAAGVIVPSRDEAARARYLTLSALGALLLEVTLRPPANPADLASIVRGYLSRSYLPLLELFTEGYLTSRRALEDCLAYMSTPP
ncbi:hypothetical protein [Glutamicibacter arilaitensis]|uniref:hypothetical protein n=1 Tax=Glutamicibacter arilaitensis TaxID=256701 RepID=UPI00384C3C6B